MPIDMDRLSAANQTADVSSLQGSLNMARAAPDSFTGEAPAWWLNKELKFDSMLELRIKDHVGPTGSTTTPLRARGRARQ
jgi:hypothetical protein